MRKTEQMLKKSTKPIFTNEVGYGEDGEILFRTLKNPHTNQTITKFKDGTRVETFNDELELYYDKQGKLIAGVFMGDNSSKFSFELEYETRAASLDYSRGKVKKMRVRDSKGKVIEINKPYFMLPEKFRVGKNMEISFGGNSELREVKYSHPQNPNEKIIVDRTYKDDGKIYTLTGIQDEQGGMSKAFLQRDFNIPFDIECIDTRKRIKTKYEKGVLQSSREIVPEVDLTKSLNEITKMLNLSPLNYKNLEEISEAQRGRFSKSLDGILERIDTKEKPYQRTPT